MRDAPPPPGNGREHRDFGRDRIRHHFLRVQPEHFQRLIGGLQIGLRLIAGGFGLLQIGQGARAASVQFIAARIGLQGQLVSVARLHEIGAQLGVIRTAHIEHDLARADFLPGRN
jgi:hypothetical protein